MKICAIICEYNPFHNGHLHQLREAKRLSGADAVLCIMSGNFVQRGEAAIMDKFTRAKHAVQAGADIVIELPTVFATANAELFAKGAIHLLSSIPAVSTLCFGCETADKSAILNASRLLLEEPKEVSDKIKNGVSMGKSYAKARAEAWENLIPSALLNSSNNILAIEYTKAILAKKANIDILPIARIGSKYNDDQLQENFSSATAIRAAIQNKTSLENQLPDFVADDLPKNLDSSLDKLEKYAIISKSCEDIAKICDCTEGLENAFKKSALLPNSLIDTLTSARYTSSRIRRIALQNLLNIDEKFIRESLSNPLYLRVLAAKKDRQDILTALSESVFPIIARAHDEKVLSNTAIECFQKDLFADDIYKLLYPIYPINKIFI